jgi:hypothetical protein
MNVEAKANKQNKVKERFSIDFSSFWVLTKMLLQDRFSLSFKSNKKKTLIKLLTSLILFAVLVAISYGFYYVCKTFNIFSVLPTVPITVPSLLSTFILILGFFNLVLGLVKTLYFSEDNRLMMTYPCNGNTIFIARMFSFFLSEYVRNLLIQVPLLLGYMVLFSFPWYTYIWLFVAWALITFVEVLLGSLLSIPTYYVVRFLKANSLIRFAVYFIFGGLVIWLAAWVLMQIPDKVNIFKDWAPYFNKIQVILNGYESYLNGFYLLTNFACGTFDGYNVDFLTFNSLYVLLTLIGSGIVLYFIVILVVNPIYFKFSSKSFEFESTSLIHSKKVRKHSFVHAQLHKELLMFGGDPSLMMSIIVTFAILPLFVALLNKIFGAMELNVNGEIYVVVINYLLISIIAMSTNSVIATAYSREGTAFSYNRVYPRKSNFVLFSKLILPMVIGIISLSISCYIFSTLKEIDGTLTVYFALSIIFIYIGHMLFSASLDFTNIRSQFMSDVTTSKSENKSTMLAFLVPVVLMVLFFYYFKDSLTTSYIKMACIGAGFLIINIVLFDRRIKLIYRSGE